MDLKIKSLTKKYNQINTSNQKARKHLLPIIDKEISEITKKWLRENDSRAKFKLTDRYKKRQQAKLAKKQARKQKYPQKLSLVRRGLLSEPSRTTKDGTAIWDDDWDGLN